MTGALLFLAIFAALIGAAIYGLSLHVVTHPDVIAKQAAARGMKVITVTADQVTSTMLPGTYYTVKLSALDGSKSVTARCHFGTGAKSLTWTSWVENPS